jgi:peptidoglycan/LPS O-acetylase OafA/YrhL
MFSLQIVLTLLQCLWVALQKPSRAQAWQLFTLMLVLAALTIGSAVQMLSREGLSPKATICFALGGLCLLISYMYIPPSTNPKTTTADSS